MPAAVSEIAGADIGRGFDAVDPEGDVRQIIVVEVGGFRAKFKGEGKFPDRMQFGILIAEPIGDLSVGSVQKLRVEALGQIAVVAQGAEVALRRTEVEVAPREFAEHSHTEGLYAVIGQFLFVIRTVKAQVCTVQHAPDEPLRAVRRRFVADGDQIGLLHFFQMEQERRCGDPEGFDELFDGENVGRRLQIAQNVQARFVAERFAESGDPGKVAFPFQIEFDDVARIFNGFHVAFLPSLW